MLSLLTAACIFVAGCCFMWGVMSLDWERIRERRMSRGYERLIRRNVLRARKRFEKQLATARAREDGSRMPAPAGADRSPLHRRLMAGVVSKGVR